MSVTIVTEKSIATAQQNAIPVIETAEVGEAPENEKSPRYPCYSRYGSICDANGVCCNPIQGDYLCSSARLFRIDGIWQKALMNKAYDLTQFEFPANWQQLVHQNSNPKQLLEQMIAAYPSKEIHLTAEVLEGLFMTSKLTWWWAGKRNV